MVKLFAFLCSGVPRPAWNPLAISATVVLDDITMAALSGASSHHDVAHGHDCDCRWRRACSIVGRAGRWPPCWCSGLHSGATGWRYGSSTGCPRLSIARGLQVSARIGVGFVGGAGLAIGMGLTAMALAGFRLAHWPAWWWLGGIAFIGIELVAHLVLQLRGRPSFYNGLG